jgi:hypothetical protein
VHEKAPYHRGQGARLIPQFMHDPTDWRALLPQRQGLPLLPGIGKRPAISHWAQADYTPLRLNILVGLHSSWQDTLNQFQHLYARAQDDAAVAFRKGGSLSEKIPKPTHSPGGCGADRRSRTSHLERDRFVRVYLPQTRGKSR